MPSEPSSVQSGFTLLSELEDADVDWLLSAGETKQVPAGSVVAEEGARLQSIFLVMEGLLGVYSGMLGGKQLATLGAGQIIGEMSFLEDRPASATVTALEDSEVLLIDREKLDAKLEADAPFAARLYRFFAVIASQRLRETVGALSRWMEVENPLPRDAATLRKWQEVAKETQNLKKLILEMERETGSAEDVLSAFTAFYQKINEWVGDDSADSIHAREELGARIQRELLPYFLRSKSVEQLYHKPRGYSGDYLSIQRLYENNPLGSGKIGVALDQCFLQIPTVRALRARRDLVKAEISRAAAASPSPFLVAALGCGPASEIFGAFARLDRPEQLKGTLIDFDAQSLSFVSARSRNLQLESNLALIDTNFFSLATGRLNIDLAPQDLVYTITLPDSCNARLLLRLLRSMKRMLKPGGIAIVGCLNSVDPSKAFNDYVVEWKILRHDERELQTLFSEAGFVVTPASRVSGMHEGVSIVQGRKTE